MALNRETHVSLESFHVQNVPLHFVLVFRKKKYNKRLEYWRAGKRPIRVREGERSFVAGKSFLTYSMFFSLRHSRWHCLAVAASYPIEIGTSSLLQNGERGACRVDDHWTAVKSCLFYFFFWPLLFGNATTRHEYDIFSIRAEIHSLSIIVTGWLDLIAESSK